MSSLRQMVAEILTFKVTLSEQNQQNLHFGYFWACIKFHFFFQIPLFWLKLLMFTHIFIFQKMQSNLRGENQRKFFKKWSPKGGPENWKLFYFPESKILWRIFIVVFVEKFAFFETLDHHNCKTAWLTSVKYGYIRKHE